MRILVAIGCIAAAALSAHADDTVDYAVQPGDTCLGISIGILGDRAELATLHRLNPQLGKMPHVLVAGQVLRLPKAERGPDAKVARTHNVVELRRANDDRWNPATVGAELFRAWRVGAREKSNARVVFADTSAIEMRENTVVVIYGATAASSKPRRATLETGALRTRLSELDGKVQLDTPAGRIAFIAGSAVVEATGATTIVSNHSSRNATLTGTKGGTSKITAGYGADVAKDKPPSKQRPLPPSPSWIAVDTLVLGWRATGATLRASWQPVTEATRYRIELATQSGDILAQVEAPAQAAAIELVGLPDDAYYLSIASVDATGLESAPRRSSGIRAGLVGIAGDAATPTQVTTGTATTRTVPAGTPIESAPGLVCTARVIDRIECTAGGATARLDVTVIASAETRSATTVREAPVRRPAPSTGKNYWLALAAGATDERELELMALMDFGVARSVSLEAGVAWSDTLRLDAGIAVRGRLGRFTPQAHVGGSVQTSNGVFGLRAGIGGRFELANRIALFGRVSALAIDDGVSGDALVGLALALD